MMNQSLKKTLDMKQKSLFHSLAFLRGLAALVAGCAAAAADPGGSPQISNFSDAGTWIRYVYGSGVQVTPSGNGFEADYAAGAQPGPNNGISAGYTSTFALRGDFTLDIDYRLKTWPAESGIRLGLGVWPSICMIRAGTAEGGQMYSGELYSFSAGPFVTVQTSDRRGTLRLVRRGGTLSGYYRSSAGGPWVLAGSRSGDPVFLQDFQVSVESWTDSSSFGGRPVALTLGNFVMTADTVLPGRYGIPVWKGGPATAIPEVAKHFNAAARRSPPTAQPSESTALPNRSSGYFPGRPRPAIQPPEPAALPTGILEEDLNLDLNAAIQSYQSLVTQFDAQRPLAANAIFRMAECYRRLGRMDEARSQYARILREFADQAPLVNLSRKYAASPTASTVGPLPAVGVSPGPPLPAGLVGRWAGEGNANDSAGTNNGVLEGNVTFAPGMVGQAFDFDGVDSYVEVPDAPALRLTDALSIEFWAKRQRLDKVEYIIEKGGDWTGGQCNYEVALHDSRGDYCLYLLYNGGLQGGGRIADYNWHHCAVTAANGSSDVGIYIDGVRQPITFTTGSLNVNLYPSERALHIGAQVDPYSGWYYYSKTYVDELAVYDRGLTPAEIRASYAAGSAGKRIVPVAPSSGTASTAAPMPAVGVSPGSPLPAGLVGRWAGEGNANDSVGANNGVLEGAVTFVPGKVGQAFSFDGTTADVRVPASPSLDVGAGAGMTIEAWIRPADLSTERPVLEWNDGSFGTLLNISVPLALASGGAGPGAFTASFKDVNLQHHIINSPPGVLRTNRFQHVAATYDGRSGDAALYLDGAIVAQANLGIFTPRTIGDLYFGLRPFDGGAGMRFVGEIDEVGVYSRALSEAEIEAIHAAGGAGQRLVPGARYDGPGAARGPLPAVGVSPGPPLPAGLVSRWAGEANANDSTGANNGVLEGAVSFVPGKVGQAFSFDGTTADVRVPASPSLDVGAGAGMTIEAWIRPADLSDQHPVLEWNDGSFGTLLWVSVSPLGGGVGPGAFTANFKDVNLQPHTINSPPGVLTTNRFQHVAATYDGRSGDAALYLDGAVVAQANLGIFTPRTIGDLYFGLRPSDGGAGMRFVGEIDEVGVYSRALSEAEIEAIHAAGGAGKRLVPGAPVKIKAEQDSWQTTVHKES
jgi:hypothetical protein